MINRNHMQHSYSIFQLYWSVEKPIWFALGSKSCTDGFQLQYLPVPIDSSVHMKIYIRLIWYIHVCAWHVKAKTCFYVASCRIGRCTFEYTHNDFITLRRWVERCASRYNMCKQYSINEVILGCVFGQINLLSHCWPIT